MPLKSLHEFLDLLELSESSWGRMADPSPCICTGNSTVTKSVEDGLLKLQGLLAIAQ